MNNSIRYITFITSMLIAILVLVVTLAANCLFDDKLNNYLIFIIGFSVFGISFLAFEISCKRLINKQMKLIYKTIHDFKINKNDKNLITQKNKNQSDVNNILELLTENKSEEIEQLKQLEQYRKEFVGNVSHELKTPIFSIQGYISTLLEGGIYDKEINMKYLLRAEKNVERLAIIVNDLDTIYRIESNELLLEYKKIDIVLLAKEIIEELELKAKTKNIELLFDKNYEKPIFVSADNYKIRQVMTNLIINSISYGVEGGKTKISFFDMGENILVEISDNGIGIDKKDLPRIFERFYRTDKSRSREQGGTGLGLAIVKHLIEAHNQIINVRSTIGVGSTFGFTLKKHK